MDLSDLFEVEAPESSLQKPDVSDVPEEPENLAQDLREDLLSWLVNGKTEPPRAPGLHCSSLWKTCARIPMLEAKYALYLQVEVLSAGQRMTFDEGHALHHLIQNSYMGPFGRLWGKWKCLSCQKVTHEGTMPLTCPECEVPWRDEDDGIQNIIYDELFVVSDALKYCGHCDGILISRKGNKVVFEFKTISPSQFRGLREPKHEHIVQVHAYMFALGIKHAVVLYWDKGSQADWRKHSDGTWSCTNPHLKAFNVSFDDDLWDRLAIRIKDYHSAEEKVLTLPTIEAEDINKFNRLCTHKSCKLAAECHVRDVCFST